MSEESILRKLVEAGSFEVTSDTKEEEVRDWKPLVEPFLKGYVYVRPLDYSDVIESVINKLCKKIAEAETDYPATWEGYSSVGMYWCPSVGRFVVVESHSDSDYSSVKFSVHKSARDAVRAYNSTISNWIDTLYDHSNLDVPGAKESAKRARELKKEKLRLKDVEEMLRRLKAIVVGLLR